MNQESAGLQPKKDPKGFLDTFVGDLLKYRDPSAFDRAANDARGDTFDKDKADYYTNV